MAESMQRDIHEIATSVHTGTAMGAIDLLTESDIGELRLLLAVSPDEREAVFVSRIEDGDRELVYRTLANLGFIECLYTWDGEMKFVGTTPKAAWAVNRYDERKENERRESRRRVREIDVNSVVALASVVVGWLLGRL